MLEKTMQGYLDHWHKETGFVGMLIMGGLGPHGHLVVHRSVSSLLGVTQLMQRGARLSVGEVKSASQVSGQTLTERLLDDFNSNDEALDLYAFKWVHDYFRGK